MNILVLGGTGYLGRYIVEFLSTAGHRVSVLNRGQSSDVLPDDVERLRGNRDDGRAALKVLDGRTWDACVDVSGYTAQQVRPSAEALRNAVGRYVFISAVACYGDPVRRPVTESDPRVEPVPDEVIEVVGENYGRLKVTCENLLQEIYAERCTFLRAQIVAGPHDPSGRHSYWVWRASQQGEMLAPGDGSDHVQVIDVRDLARFTTTVVEYNLSGAFNLAGPRFTWNEFIEILGVKDVVWVPAKIIRSAGVHEFELPLFRTEHGPRSGLMDISHDKAVSAGLVLTDPRETVDAIRSTLPVDFQSPLSAERERELICLARRQKSD